MEKVRSNFELWLIVQSNFERIYDSFGSEKGVCNVVNVLCTNEELITWDELVILKKIINDYKRARNIGLFENPYIWDKHARKPRRLFIHRQILKAIKNNN